jgi:PPM family protein phosphatase
MWHETYRATKPAVIVVDMVTKAQGYRLSAATGTHRGDRTYQQDQVAFIAHPHVPGCGMAVLADGMGGKSGGRKAADQVIMVAEQLYERFAPTSEDPQALLESLVRESHQMIRLTAMTAEEEPHSTIASFIVGPDRVCHVAHAGDSRVYHFRGAEMQMRTFDHSLVQRMVNEGRLTEDEALTHPQSNLLTGCLGTAQDPPIAIESLGTLAVGDTLMACSDGLWHYFNTQELGAIAHTLPPREASELLIDKARQRARGGGDNISVAIVRVEAYKREMTRPMPLGKR